MPLKQGGELGDQGGAQHDNAAASHELIYPQIVGTFQLLAGGGTSKNIWNFSEVPRRGGRSRRDLLHFRQGFEIEMNFDRNVSCFVAVDGFMDNDFFDKAV